MNYLYLKVLKHLEEKERENIPAHKDYFKGYVMGVIFAADQCTGLEDHEKDALLLRFIN